MIKAFLKLFDLLLYIKLFTLWVSEESLSTVLPAGKTPLTNYRITYIPDIKVHIKWFEVDQVKVYIDYSQIQIFFPNLWDFHEYQMYYMHKFIHIQSHKWGPLIVR